MASSSCLVAGALYHTLSASYMTWCERRLPEDEICWSKLATVNPTQTPENGVLALSAPPRAARPAVGIFGRDNDSPDQGRLDVLARGARARDRDRDCLFDAVAG